VTDSGAVVENAVFLAACGFLIVAGLFLLTEHTAHVFGILPYLLLLACPLMHFMRHGHGRGGGDGRSDAPTQKR
jgi:hypothetical protein